uniref:Uncharacterized protein n=1 Tax=Rangifer tarandus platyrhynchus TaxID=3082113 RepID=A0ACB0DSZ0_RANTA|nr:unnamed protein product [Rangifer tarandus platyrhynchus]
MVLMDTSQWRLGTLGELEEASLEGTLNCSIRLEGWVGIRGGSVLFHVIKKQEAEPEEVSWGFGPESNYSVLLRVHRGADTPTWLSLHNKYQHRVHVPNNLSLKIENLTCEDSGHYRARVSFTGGLELTQIFLLTVYEPVPSPQILMGSASITPDWCNVTLECRASGATEDLNVTWEYKGLPEEWEQRRTLESASNSRILAVSLPRGQPHASLVCVVSNPVGYKTASFDLGRICIHDSANQVNADLLSGICGAGAAVLLILGGGLCLWKIHGKKMKTVRGRLPFSFHAHIPLFLHWILNILSPTICCLEMSLQRG